MAHLDPSRGLIGFTLRHPTGKWLVLAGLVGIFCGILGLAFHRAVESGIEVVLEGWCGYHPPAEHGRGAAEGVDEALVPGEAPGPRFAWWWLLLALPLGGLVSGLLVHFLAPSAAGAGTEAAIHAFHYHRGRIPLRATIAKFFASIAVLITGGSAGREGPIAMVGAGIASFFSQRLGLSSRDRRILLAAGIGGGVAAIFRAPLAGALFAAEVLYRDPELEADVLIPSFISSIVAFCTFGVLAGLVGGGDGMLSTLFHIGEEVGFEVDDVLQLAGYLVLALVLIAATRLFIKTLDFGGLLFAKIPVPPWVRPALGGLSAGLVALVLLFAALRSGLVEEGDGSLLSVLGSGYGMLQQLFYGGAAEAPWVLMVVLLLIAIGKMATTACTVGSGGSGGIFGPSIVIGGCLGGSLGLLLNHWTFVAELGIAPPMIACVLMGMAGFFAAGYHTPVAALLMVSEMTGNYDLLLPAMWVCAICFLLSGKRTIVTSQVSSPVHSPAHRGHFFNDILAGIRVAEVFDPGREVPTLHPESSIDDCKRLVATSHQTVYPVVDHEGRLVGIFNMNDLRSFLFDDTLGLVAVAEDVATKEIITLRPRDSLATAMRRFTQRNLEELPVVADDDEKRFLGLLTRREVIAYYNTVVDHLRDRRREEGYEVDSSASSRHR